MPKKYTEYEKQDALDILAENMDNVVLTSQQTKVPLRTLRDWRHKAILRGLYSPENIIQGRRREIPEKTRDQFISLRDTLMGHVYAMTETLSIHDEFVNHRAIAVSRLVDRVVKIDQMLSQTLKDDELVTIFKYDYGGKLHDEPPWENPEVVGPEAVAQWEEMLNHPDAPYNFRHSPHLKRLWAQRQAEKQPQQESESQENGDDSDDKNLSKEPSNS